MMNCFTVSAGRLEYSITTTERMILVGEEGRSRKIVRVPIPAGAEHWLENRDCIVRVPLRDEGDALLLVKDHSGYRGDWKLLPPRAEAGYEAIVARRRAHSENIGGPHSAYGDCEACAATQIPDRLPAAWRIIAEGACAQGDAGRMGGGPEYLLVLPAGAGLQISRTGRLYGEPDILLVSNIDGYVSVSDPLAEAETRLAMPAGGAW